MLEFTFACYYPGEKPLFITIDISLDAWVTKLLKVIYDELNSQGRKVTLQDLRLYKTDIPLQPVEDLQQRALQWLHQQPLNSHLDLPTKVKSKFPNGPNLSDDELHILVVDTEVLELLEGLRDPQSAYQRKLKKALDQSLDRLAPNLSPSEIVHSPDKMAELLGGDKSLIHLSGDPAALFNPALAILQRNLENLEEVKISPSDVVHASQYLRYVTKFNKNEAQRLMTIMELIEEATGNKGEWGSTLVWADRIKPGGCWWYGLFLTQVLELKNMLGLSGDALLQTVIDYSKIIGRERYKPYREYCNFPIVLLGVTANCLEVSIAVCVGAIYVSKLLALDLSSGFHASDNIVRLARVFRALSLCRVDLQSYYDEVTSLAHPKLSCLYPNPTLADPSKLLPKLVYRHFLSRVGQPTSTLVNLGTTTTAMYIATLDTSQEVVVKFTTRYNEEAHRLLVEHKLAPTLHFCERVIGNLYMVVMDRVDGKSLWQLQMEGTPLPSVVSKKVEEAVDLLHGNDIVVGDLRDPNILYVASKGDDEGCVVLVDLDWPAKDEKGRYPAALNPNNAWCEDVRPYGIMRKSHDLWQLNRLKALCAQCGSNHISFLVTQ